MAKQEVIPSQVKVKTPVEELRILATLAQDENYMVVLRRMARRYIEMLRNSAFHLNEKDSHFNLDHAELRNQAVGINNFIALIEYSIKKLNELDKKE